MSLIASTLASITVGEASTFQNLTIFPLLKGGHHAAGYHTLDEARLSVDGELVHLCAYPAGEGRR